MTIHELRDEVASFLREHALTIGLTVVAMVIAYGFGVASFALSIDEDTAYTVDWTRNWIEQGRPMIAVVKFVLADSLALPFYDMALALVFHLTAGVTWAFLLVHAARPTRIGKAGLLVFLVIFTTLPVNAYYLAFDTLSVEVALAWVFAALSVWLAWRWAVEAGGPIAFIGSVALALVAMLTYQDFAFAIVAGVVVLALASLIGRGAGATVATRASLGRVIRLALPVVSALALAAVALLLLIRDERVASLVVWGTGDPLSMMRSIYEGILAYARGEGFHGGWVVIPTIVAWLVLLALTAIRGLAARRWLPTLLVVVLGLLPFALWFGVGHPLPNRSMQAGVLVAAAIWPLLALEVGSRRGVGLALLVVAALLGVWNGGAITRSFVTEHQTYETDRSLAREIGERLVRAGWDGNEIVLVTVGNRSQSILERVAQQEFVGFSLFNDTDGRRSPGLLRLLGYEIRSATPEEDAAAHARAETMPVWPAAGAVVLEDGVAVVKFSEP